MMFNKLKHYISSHLPVNQKQYQCESQQILDLLAVQKISLESLKTLQQSLDKVENQQLQYQKIINCQQQQLDKLSATLISKSTKEIEQLSSIESLLDSTRMETTASIKKLINYSKENIRSSNESVWAQIFNNTITNSSWLLDKTFSPGRWAVGYPELYVIYRILNEFHPKHILEIGLGQSTRMFAQYAAAFSEVQHLVVEHDPDWIYYFCEKVQMPNNSRIVQLEREMVPYKEAPNVRVFKGFQDALQGMKFDFIFVDAPLGSDMKEYSRIDVLSLLPQCLARNFAILMDDAERTGEKHTLEEIKNILQRHGINFKQGRYAGKSDCSILCSTEQAFLSSL